MHYLWEFNPNKNVIIFNLLNEMENSSVVIYFFTENIMAIDTSVGTTAGSEDRRVSSRTFHGAHSITFAVVIKIDQIPGGERQVVYVRQFDFNRIIRYRVIPVFAYESAYFTVGRIRFPLKSVEKLNKRYFAFTLYIVINIKRADKFRSPG